MKTLLIDFKDSNQRLDKFLLKFFNRAPKSFVYKMLRKKNIKLNEAKASGSEILRPGDKIYLYLSEDTINEFKCEVSKPVSCAPVDVLSENEDVLVCVKPVGVLSQPSSKFDTDTLLNRLYNIYGQDICICNRLDRNTSGIVICGKNFFATQQVNKLISSRQINKFYLTLVKGKVTQSGVLRGFIEKDGQENKSQTGISGKKVITQYRPLKFNDKFSLLEVKLITGRSHQIRVHLSSIGHPVIGDKKYGDARTNLFFEQKFGLQHQILHAYKINICSEPNNIFANMPQEITCNVPKAFADIEKFCFG